MQLIPGKSGQAPFDNDDLPGHDASGDNNIVRTNDRFDYRVLYNALDTNQVNFVFTAPVGVYWLSSGANTSVCNGTGGPALSANGRILTCPRKPADIQLESFELPAIAGNIAHGTEFSIAVTAGTVSATSQIVKISAIAKNEIYVQGSSYAKKTIGGVYGASYGLALRPGMSTHTTGSSVGTVKGLESPKVPLTITISTLPPGTIVTSCPGTCSQPGGPGTPVYITLNNLNNTLSNSSGVYANSSVFPNYKEFSYNGIDFFTPFGTSFPAGAKTPLIMKFTDYAPESLSGAVNYLGSTSTGYAPDYAPGYAPGFNTCPDGHSCIRLLIDRTIKTEVVGGGHGSFYTPTGELIYGDSEAATNHPSAGAESVLPGHYFSMMYPVSNTSSAEEPAHNVGSCMVWDPAKMELQSNAKLKLGGGGEFFRYGSTGWPDVVTGNYIMEYSSQSYASDTARKSAACGVAGDGSANWSTDPNSVPGGISAVSSVRYKYLSDLLPGGTLGFLAAFRRPLTSYSLNAPYMTLSPWFSQFWADEKARVVPSPYGGVSYSNYGGRVNFVNALFRHKITASSNSVAPGGIISMTVTPIAIGSSITGVDAVVKNAKVKVTMPDTCLEPVPASLPSFATLTPPNYGADGIPCTGDAGETAANVVFSLGDYDAPGGAITAGGYQGHATFQPTFSFNILAASKSPVKTVTWTSFDSADNDPTPVSHTITGSVAIAGVAGFSVTKTTSGTTNGKIGPNEIFNYIINFGNGGSSSSGKGRFVDVLPYDGDSRGTVGLGTGKMVVTGLTAAMASASQGTVQMQVTTDNPSTLESILAVPGQEDGETGITWTNYIAGASFPENVTAVRFLTSSDLKSGFSGFGSIQVRAPTIKASTVAFNNVWGRTDPFLGDISTIKIMRGVANLKVQGIDGATIRGKVFIDLDDDGVIDGNEVGLSNTLVSITCTAGACLTAPQGTTFSLKTDSAGGYSFEPNLANKVFPNDSATGTTLSVFDGTVAGTWKITETPPSSATQPFINVSTKPGTINSVPSGTAAGRSITGVAMVGNGAGINYLFGERLVHGKITVTKALTIPSNVTGSFNFGFTATCDKPVAGSTFSATLSNFPTNTSVDIVNIPADATCVMSETLPAAPNGYGWATPVFSAFTPTGVMAAAGTQATTATNALVQGVTVAKTVVGTPTVISGNPTQFDVKYKIEVKNTTPQAVTYSASDAFGFDSDVEVVGTPTVVASSNVSSTVNAAFTGTGTNKNLVTNESIAAGSVATPTIESIEITVRINIKSFGVANNTCNSSTGAGAGLSNQATLTVNGIDTTSTACINTPVPATGKITVTKSFTRPSDVTASFNFDFKATCDLPTAGSVFTATLTGFPGTTSTDILNIPAGATCTVSETLPTAPNAYSWSTPVVGTFNPSGAMTAAGTQTVTVTNALVNGLTIAKTVDAPVAVSGQPDQFDVTYHIAVTNSTSAAIAYDLNDSFGFDTDLQIVGTPTITKSSNVSSTISSGFNGASSSTIVTGESIAAASGTPLVPVVETYDVKVRVKVAGFTASNNACSGTGTGLFNTATAKVGGVSRTSSVCTSTPDAKDGKIVVTNLLQLPPEISTPITFTYKAKCDKPVADSIFSANLAFSNSTNVVEIPGIPAGASCVVSQVLPPAPTGYQWKTPVIGSLSPTGSMPAGASQSLSVNNELVQGVSIKKSVVGTVTEVTGQADLFDVTYKIEVSNSTDAEVVYSLTDTFGFEPDVKVIGLPTVEKSANVNQNLNSAFTGVGTNTNLIASEKIAASVNSVVEVETYTVKARVQIVGFNESNNACENISGKGLFNTATMGFGSSAIAANTCIATPTLKPASFVLEVLWETGRVGAQVVVPGMTFNSTSAASVLSSTNNGPGTRSSGDTTVVQVGEKGVLPSYAFTDQKDLAYHKVSRWNCEGVLHDAGEELTIPSSIAGRGMVCLLSIQGLTLETTKTAIPASGLSITPGDSIEYTLSTTLAGVELQEDFVLTDTLGAGLIFVGKAPDGCQVNAQVLTCTIPKRSLAGVYKFVYKATVDDEAANNSNPGVSNKVSTSLGACDKCATYHGIWTADTKKVSDATGKKGIRIGDNIRYTVSVTIANGPSSQAITVKDTRSVGLLVTKVPDGCSQKGRVITCVVPAGSATGVYSFIYNATVTKDAGDYVTNKAVSDKGTCLTSCSTSVKVLKEVMLRVSKTSNLKQVKIGDFVRYEILVENLSDIDANEFFILDKAAPGLNFVEGSVRVTGDASWSVQSNYPLKITNLDLEASKKTTISYLMRVGAGAGRGKLSNQAWADDDQDFVSSNIATASVTRGSDPDFEDTHIMGVVFEDSNGNGIQDESEPGIAGARLTTAQGLVVETDAFGRYHIEGIDPGALARGSNYVVKLDTNSLPKGSKVTTQNPLVKRLTQGMPVVFNFGIR